MPKKGKSGSSGKSPEGQSTGSEEKKRQSVSSRVKEGFVSYGSSIDKGMAFITNLTSRPEFELTPLEKMQMVEEGISKKAFEILKHKSGLDYHQLSQLLNVSRTTLIGKKGNAKFNTDVSDKILGLADIYSYGYEVFEDRDRFNEWIFRPNAALGGQQPFEILHNSYGREEVKNLIGRIDRGVYS